MVDTKYLVDTNAIDPPEVGLLNNERPRINSDGDIERHWKPKDPYKHYDDIDPDACGSLGPQQYMICDYNVWAFVLQTRRVGMSSYRSKKVRYQEAKTIGRIPYVNKISRPVFQVDSIKDLVLDDDAKAMIKALSQRYTMQTGTEEA